MGLFSYIQNYKNEKKIQVLINEIGVIFYDVECVEHKNINLFSASEISRYKSDLCVVVNKVREIEHICDTGDRSILRSTSYDNRWFSRSPLSMVIKKILETVISCRSNLNEPTIFQEEFDVFIRYDL